MPIEKLPFFRTRPKTHQFLEGGREWQQSSDAVLGDDLEPSGRRLQPNLGQTLIRQSHLVDYQLFNYVDGLMGWRVAELLQVVQE